MALPLGTELDLQREAFLRLPLGVAILRLDDVHDARSLRVVDCNDTAAAVNGLTREGVIGRRLADYSPQTFENGRAEIYADVVRTGTPQTVGMIDPATSMVLAGSYAVYAFPLSDQCVGLLWNDVTARRQAEERERLSSRQLERAHEIARL